MHLGNAIDLTSDEPLSEMRVDMWAVTLDAATLKATLLALSGKDQEDAQIERIMKAVRPGHDGTITGQELMDFVASGKVGPTLCLGYRQRNV